MAEGSMMELAVSIKAIDFFTGPLRSMVSSITAAEGKFASLNNTMKMMGKSKSEIDAINSSLNRMADQKAFANVASDLEKIGMAKSDIAAMEGSYMRMAQYQRDMAKAQADYAAGKDLAMSGVGNLATGAIGAFGIFEMVKQAGEFQSNLATIQDTTGATNKEMQDFGNAIMNASAQVSKFNDFQMAQIAQTLTSGGFGNIKQAQSLLLPAAKFAEVQGYENKQSDPIEATKQAIEMAHIFKTYDPKSFQNFLDTFNKYSMMQPGDSSSLVQTLTYLAPKAQTLGMSQSDIMALSALDNRIGLTGSHGGTNSADMILRLIPGLVGGGPKVTRDKKGNITKVSDPKAWAAMKKLGFIDDKGNSQFFDSKGNITDLNGMLTTMINDGKKLNKKDLTAAYHDIFGAQGGNAASILANPTSLEQLAQMRKQLSKTKGLDQIHTDHQNTAAGQLNLLKSNSMTLMLRVGQQLAISLNPAIKSINDLLGKMLEFSQAHPQVAKLIGDFALFAVGGKLAEGVVKIFAGNFIMLSKAIKMFKLKNAAGEATKFGKVINALKFKNAAGELTRFGKIATGTWNGLKKGTGVINDLVSKGVTKLGSGLKTAGSAIKSLGSSFLSGVRAAGRFSASLAKITGKAAISAIKGVGSALKILGTGFLNAGKAAGRFVVSLAKITGKAAIASIRGIGSALKLLGSGLMSAMKWIGQFAVTLAKLGVQALKWAVQMAADWIIAMGPIGWIIAGVTATIALFVVAWKNDWGHIREHTAQAIAFIKSHLDIILAAFGPIGMAVSALMKAWQSNFGGIRDTTMKVINDIKKIFSDLFHGDLSKLPSDMLKLGGDIINGLVKGIQSAIGAVKSAISNVASTVTGAFKSMLGIHSPSKVFMDHGKFIVQGLSMGIDQNAQMATKSTTDLAKGISNSFKPNTKESISLGKNQPATPNQYNDNSQITFQPGSIVINPQPGQDAKTLARDIMNELGKQLRKEGYRTGRNPVNAW